MVKLSYIKKERNEVIKSEVYVCSVCGMEFNKLHEVERHIKQHTCKHTNIKYSLETYSAYNEYADIEITARCADCKKAMGICRLDTFDQTLLETIYKKCKEED